MVALVMVTSLLATSTAVLAPIFTRVFTDYVLSQEGSSWYPSILYAFAAVIAFQLVASVINQILIIRAKGRVAATSSARFMRHVLLLPMEFFGHHKAGDLADRQASNDEIAETLIGELAPLLINMAMLVFYLAVMVQYNVLLTAVGVATIAINLLVVRKVSSLRREMIGVGARNRANLSATTVSGIDMLEGIERTDKACAVGVQFHPEAAIVKHTGKAVNNENADLFMTYDSAINLFRAFISVCKK